jgi:hypothetical protein
MKPKIYWCKRYKRILPDLTRYTRGCNGSEKLCSRCEELIRFKNIDTFMRWTSGCKNPRVKLEWHLSKLKEAEINEQRIL